MLGPGWVSLVTQKDGGPGGTSLILGLPPLSADPVCPPVADYSLARQDDLLRIQKSHVGDLLPTLLRLVTGVKYKGLSSPQS